MQTFEEYQFKVKHNDICNKTDNKSIFSYIKSYAENISASSNNDGIHIRFDFKIPITKSPTYITGILYDRTEKAEEKKYKLFLKGALGYDYWIETIDDIIYEPDNIEIKEGIEKNSEEIVNMLEHKNYSIEDIEDIVELQ